MKKGTFINKIPANFCDVVFYLKGQTEVTERGQKFWNTSEVEMKVSFEREWIKAVRRAKGRPNSSIGNMNHGPEEVCGNKLELSGPLVDSYLLEIGKQMSFQDSIAWKPCNPLHPLADISPHYRLI